MTNVQHLDAVIIGGGFYGSVIAIYLAEEKGLRNITVLEREPNILTRASYTNQARVHNGYHYPRSFTTAYRSRINLPKFVERWPEAIYADFTKLYAIARRNSKVTAMQFLRFCKSIGAEIRRADQGYHSLFNRYLVEDVFEVKEFAFDTTKLARWVGEELARLDINVIFNAEAEAICYKDSLLKVKVLKDDAETHLVTPLLFNCTYSGLGQFGGDYIGVRSQLKHEITEMALVKMPSELEHIGITVMDGPFFSAMPFPARNLHTLSHVRYTPHVDWVDQMGIDPYQLLDKYEKTTRFDRMARDSSRYVPLIADAEYKDSLFEIKTVLMKNESDDGRPILFEKHDTLPGMYSILGGKIDNIFDVLERIDFEIMTLSKT